MLPLKVPCWYRPPMIILLFAVAVVFIGGPSGVHHIVVSAVQFPSLFASILWSSPGVPYSIMAFIPAAESMGIHLASFFEASSSLVVVTAELSLLVSLSEALLQAKSKRLAAQIVRVRRFI